MDISPPDTPCVFRLRWAQSTWFLSPVISSESQSKLQYNLNSYAKLTYLATTLAEKLAKPAAIHFVGSSNLSSATETFQKLSATFPGHLLRIPDGEPGSRSIFIQFQLATFSQCPWVLQPFALYKETGVNDETAFDNEVQALRSEKRDFRIRLNPSGYDDAAIESYAEFCHLKKEGMIELNVKFQVCLPNPHDVVAFCVIPAFQVEVERAYEVEMM